MDGFHLRTTLYKHNFFWNLQYTGFDIAFIYFMYKKNTG
jgi:hypothetical protein